MKTCSRCKINKSRDQFYSRGDLTLASYCKPCHRAKARESDKLRRQRTREARLAEMPEKRVDQLNHSTKSLKKKAEVLGMSYGKARNLLVRNLLFVMAQQLGMTVCFRCGFNIDNDKNLSIDHKSDWLAIGPSAFFDINNIAFSHFSCNVGASSGGRVMRAINAKKRTNANGLRFCGSCRQYLGISMFNKDNARQDGLSAKCKVCNAKLCAKRNKRIRSQTEKQEIATL